jgi:hypothetical protein
MAESEDVIRRYTSISSVIDTLQRKELALLDPQTWDDRNDRYFMALYKDAKALGGLYALCAARCRETYHHWRVFTNTADGACLEIRRRPLEEALTDLPGVRYSNVEYLTLPRVEDLTAAHLDRLPFLKRHGFMAEEEYRIIAETGEAQQAALNIAMPVSWISGIYLNPWLPAPIAVSLTKTLKALPGCGNLKVYRSQLVDSGRWKQAGDRVVGKKPPRKRLVLGR